MGYFAELHGWLLSKNKAHASSPSLDHLDAAEQFGNERIPPSGDVTLAYFVNRQATIQLTGIADFNAIFENGYLHIVRIGDETGTGINK